MIDEGARARLQRLRHVSPWTLAARRRLADHIRSASLGQDPDATDRVKHLGLVESAALAAPSDLARRGHRGASSSDLLIAACAHVHAAGALHYDRGYDQLAE